MASVRRRSGGHGASHTRTVARLDVIGRELGRAVRGRPLFTLPVTVLRQWRATTSRFTALLRSDAPGVGAASARCCRRRVVTSSLDLLGAFALILAIVSLGLA